MVYLFVGQDSLAKDIKLKAIKKETLPPEIADFNFDILYARELTLKLLQERLLSLPVKTKQRIMVIRDAQELKEDLREFIRGYVRKPLGYVKLILDMDRRDARDGFMNDISRFVQTVSFKEDGRIDTFTLSRQIELKKADSSLRLLNELLENGEKPERILGGLRYVWERQNAQPQEARKRLKLLLSCDIDIKTGRLRPDFALERLVVRLCGPAKP